MTEKREGLALEKMPDGGYNRFSHDSTSSLSCGEWRPGALTLERHV